MTPSLLAITHLSASSFFGDSKRRTRTQKTVLAERGFAVRNTELQSYEKPQNIASPGFLG
jgi:hypothetical protein